MSQFYAGSCHYDLSELSKDGRWLSKATPSNRVTRYCPFTFPTVTGQCTMYIFPGSLASGGLVGVIAHYNDSNIITKYERMYYNVNTDDEGCAARNIVTKVSAISSTVATGNAAISGTINACIPCDNATKIIGGPESLSYTRLLSVATPLDQISGVPASTGVSSSFYFLDQCFHQIGSSSSSSTENSDPQSTVWSQESAMCYNGYNTDPTGVSIITGDDDPVPGFTTGPVPFVSISDCKITAILNFSTCTVYDVSVLTPIEYHATLYIYNKNDDVLWSNKQVIASSNIYPPVFPPGNVTLQGLTAAATWVVSQKNFVTNSDGSTYDMIDHIEIQYHVVDPSNTYTYTTTPYVGSAQWECVDRFGQVDGIGSRYLMIGFKGFSTNQQVTCNVANIVDFKVDAPRCASFEPNASVYDPECRSALKQVLNNPSYYGWSQLTTPVELRNNMRMLEMALSLAVDEAHADWEDFVPRAAQYAVDQEANYDKAMLSEYARMYPDRAGSSAQMSMKSVLRGITKVWHKVPKPIQDYTKGVLNGAKTNLKRIGAEELNNILKMAGNAVNDGSLFYDPLGTGERILVGAVKDAGQKLVSKDNISQFKKDIRPKKTMLESSVGAGLEYKAPRFMVLESNRPRQTFMSGPLRPNKSAPSAKPPLSTNTIWSVPKTSACIVPGINVSAITREANKNPDTSFDKVVQTLAARRVDDIGDAWIVFPVTKLPKEAPRPSYSITHAGKKFYNWTPSSRAPIDRLNLSLKTDMMIASVVKQDNENWFVDLKPTADGRSVELALYVWNLGFRFSNCMFTGSIDGDTINPIPLSTSLIKAAVAMKNDLAIVGNFQNADYRVTTLLELRQLLGSPPISQQMSTQTLTIPTEKPIVATRDLGDDWVGKVLISQRKNKQLLSLGGRYDHPLIASHVVNILEGMNPKLASATFEVALTNLYEKFATRLIEKPVSRLEKWVDNLIEKVKANHLLKIEDYLQDNIEDQVIRWMKTSRLVHLFFGLSEFIEGINTALRDEVHDTANIRDLIRRAVYVMQACYFQSSAEVEIEINTTTTDPSLFNQEEFVEAHFEDAPLDWYLCPLNIFHENKYWTLYIDNRVYIRDFHGNILLTDLTPQWFKERNEDVLIYCPLPSAVPTYADVTSHRARTSGEFDVTFEANTTRISKVETPNDRPFVVLSRKEKTHNTLATKSLMLPNDMLINDSVGNVYKLIPKYRKQGFGEKDLAVITDTNKANLMPGPIWAAFKASNKAAKTNKVVDGITPAQGAEFAKLINDHRSAKNRPNPFFGTVQTPEGFQPPEQIRVAKRRTKRPSVSRAAKTDKPNKQSKAKDKELTKYQKAMKTWASKSINQPPEGEQYEKYLELYVRFPQLTQEQKVDTELLEKLLSNVIQKCLKGSYLLLAAELPNAPGTYPSEAPVVGGQTLPVDVQPEPALDQVQQVDGEPKEQELPDKLPDQ